MKHPLLTAATAGLLALSPMAQAQDLKLSHVRLHDATIDVGTGAIAAAVAAAMSDKVRAIVWPQMLEVIGKDWGQAIHDKVAAAN